MGAGHRSFGVCRGPNGRNPYDSKIAAQFCKVKVHEVVKLYEISEGQVSMKMSNLC